MKPSAVLVLAAGALLACGRAGSAAEEHPSVASARPAVYTSEDGAPLEARPVQYVYASPYGYTSYGVNGYAYSPASYYLTPYYDGPSWRTSYYAPSWSTDYYAPGAYTYSSYQPYYVSHGPVGYSYGWLPYAHHYRPYGSFYRYYGPAYGSGFHLWFGY